jgi:hypothetical protein
MSIQGGGCGRETCCVSTDICENPTFGQGELDDFGFWEFPCEQCARAWEVLHPEDAPCWPFAEDKSG